MEALRTLTWQGADADPAETLAAVAAALELDAAVVPAHEPWAADAVEQLARADVAAIWTVGGMLSGVARRMGWTEALKRSATQPGALAAPIAEALHDSLEAARAGVSAGAQALLVADELATGTGWLLSPDFALEALMPGYRQLARVGSWPAGFHSDGDIRALYPALKAAGYSAVHVATSGAGATTAAFSAARSHGLVPMGGIEARALFAEGARSIGSAAGLLAAGGPAVLCDDGGMTSGEELAAYSSALDAARKASRGGGA
jgi:hypothetical protein